MIWTSSLAGMKSFATDLVLCVSSSLLLALSQPILGPRRDETCFGLRCKPAPLWTQATDFDKAFITSPNLCKRLLLLAQQMESPSLCPQSLCATVLRRGTSANKRVQVAERGIIPVVLTSSICGQIMSCHMSTQLPETRPCLIFRLV
jgi:hypothetical protein